MSVMRQRIAEHMVLSKRVSPHVYSFDEADMSRIISVREGAKDEFEKRHRTKLTFSPCPFLSAPAPGLAHALSPLSLPSTGTASMLPDDINIGIAVAGQRLIVPVLKHADEKNFVDPSAE